MMAVFWVVATCRLVEVYRLSEALAVPVMRMIVLMMEAISTSETSMNFYNTTWRSVPEHSRL
jgi:hypothetical protein